MQLQAALACVLAVHLLASPPACAFENVLSAAGEVRKDSPRLPLHTSRALHSVYGRAESILERLRDLTASCENANLGTVGGNQGREDQELLYVTLTKKKSYLREHIMRKRTRVVFVFGEAARESFVTTAVAMNMVEAACAPPSAAAGKTHAAPPQPGPIPASPSIGLGSLPVELAHVMEFAELVLVPLVSPTGRKLAESGGFCEVVNARGVDLNRNFPVGWGKAPEVDPSVRDPYPNRGNESEDGANGSPPIIGKEPFSEWETQALRTIVTNLQPSAFVSISSGYDLALSPPGECHPRKNPLRNSDQVRLKAISDRIAAMHCWKCSQKSLIELTGSGRCGSAVDWAYDTLSKSSRGGAAFVYSWRVYANSAASPLDCLRSFNPITKRTLSSVTNRWGHAMLTLTRAVHDWRLELRSNGHEVAMRKLLDATASAVRAPAAEGRTDIDEEESVASEADGHGHRLLRFGDSKGVKSSLREKNIDKSSDIRILTLSLLACLATACGLILMRNFIFTQKRKAYRYRKRRGGLIARAIPSNFFKVQ